MLTTAGDEEIDEKDKNEQKCKDFDNIDVALNLETEAPFNSKEEDENQPGLERQKTENLDAKWLQNYV